MPTKVLEEYRWRGARALVILHEQEMRALVPVWRKAVAAGVRLPPTDDPSYQSLEGRLHPASLGGCFDQPASAPAHQNSRDRPKGKLPHHK